MLRAHSHVADLIALSRSRRSGGLTRRGPAALGQRGSGKVWIHGFATLGTPGLASQAVSDRLPLGRAELFGATAGGIRVDDPASDLAVAAALVSAATGVAPPADAAFVGEVSLTGAVRAASGFAQRIGAARAVGLSTVFAAPGARSAPNVHVVPVRHIAEAFLWAGSGAPRSARRSA